MEVVSALDAFPDAFHAADADAEGLEFDLGNLAAFDGQPIDPALLAGDREAKLQELTLAGTQALIHRLFNLPAERTDAGPLVRCRQDPCRVLR